MRTLKEILDSMLDLPSFAGTACVEVNTIGNFGEMPIHVAALQNDVEAIQILSDAGANINASGEHGYTPLHEAIEQGNPEAIRILLKLGADPNISSRNGLTAIELARDIADENIVVLLNFD